MGQSQQSSNSSKSKSLLIFFHFTDYWKWIMEKNPTVEF